ncbi:MAG TPA: ClpXP protease specificity-enhancing factor SspB [Caulobacteraceae bacterium]|nr:ClpXP protease specificity-enhancing factor SspB [Caulobacteraceae bacterium]
MAKDGKPRDLVGYEALQQEALRGVVRAALKLAAAKGLPGDHHFYITFKTGAPGVSLPRELLEQYPDEMRIALQHQYWDLAPGETFFSVTLKFGGQSKSLSIPYAAITHFWDPSVEYQLRFSVPEPAPAPAKAPALAPAAEPQKDVEKPGDGPKIVSLDQFRKK